MQHEIFISARDGVVRVAQLEAGVLVGVEIAPADAADSARGQIYLARVERVVEHLQAAFVEIGEERAGFLGAREARVLLPGAARETPIEECVAAGDEVLVQITRPAQGEKGAQLTADVSLPGRVAVIAPCRNRVAVSRAIEDEAERARLAGLAAEIVEGKHGEKIEIEGMDGAAGWVIRTAAAGMGADELARDMHEIAAAWEDLLDRADAARPPCLLHSDLGAVERALRDMVRADTKCVTVEGDDALATAKAYCARLPSLPDDICVAAEAATPLFERYDVEAQIQAALAPRVDLPSGGWLMIEVTEAMVTIDVNSGSDTATPAQVNLEAATEIGRQIGLRALGGLIAIDFIDTPDDTAANDAVLRALAESFSGDKAPVRIGEMSDFGVVEMTRRRPPQSLRAALDSVSG